MAAEGESSYTMYPSAAADRGEVTTCNPVRNKGHLNTNGDVADLRIDFESDQMGLYATGSFSRESDADQEDSDIDSNDEPETCENAVLPPTTTNDNEHYLPTIWVNTNGSKTDIPGNERLDVTVAIDDEACIIDDDGKKRWRCNQCPKMYSSKHNLMTHILGHSGIKPHACQECGKLFKQLSHLNTHMLVHGGVRPHRCQVCDKTFTQSGHLKRHMMQHTESRPHSCGICGRGFAYPSELRSHEAKHADSKDNICVECGAEFLSLAMLKRHLATHRGPNSYQCTECDKTFMYPSQLNNHLMKHQDIRPHICSECGMEFFQVHHLKQHSLTHRGVKEHKCPICGREFTLHANMKRHLQIHSNSRNFRCNVCGRAFNQRQTLKAHMVTHSEVKPFKCKVCGKEFTRFHNLSGHMHLHSDAPKPFKCTHCNSKFTLKGNLMRHMKVKHGIDGPSTRATITSRTGDADNSEDNSMQMSDDMEGSYEGNTDEGMDTSFSSGGAVEEEEEDLEEDSVQEKKFDPNDDLSLSSEGGQVDTVSSQPPVSDPKFSVSPPTAESFMKQEPISPPSTDTKYLDMPPQLSVVDTPPIDMSLLYRSQPGPKPRVPQKFECPLCPTRFTQRCNMLRHMRQKHWEDYQRTYVRADPDTQHTPAHPQSHAEGNLSFQGTNKHQPPFIGQPSQYFMSSTPVSGLPPNLPKLHFKKRHLAGGDHWDVNVYLREAVESIPPPISSTNRTQYGYTVDYGSYSHAASNNESESGWRPPVMDLPKGLHV